MKQLSFAALIICGFVACNTATTSTENTTDTTASMTSPENENITYAYTPMYSGDFTIGDSKNAQTVLEIWKDFDNNTLDNHKNAFADTVSFDSYDGHSMRVARDSMMSIVKSHRNSLSATVSSVEVVVPLKPKGKDESWVCVWGKEVDTHSNNKVDSFYLNENWMFDKDGKVAYVGQYKAEPPVKK